MVNLSFVTPFFSGENLIIAPILLPVISGHDIFVPFLFSTIYSC